MHKRDKPGHAGQFPLYLSLLLAAVLLVAVPKSLYSHANLLHSEPAAGSVLTEPPDELILEYSEALDARLTAVRLLDATGQIVVEGPGSVDPARPQVWRLPLPPLPDGTYRALWQARSAVDGHTTSGSVGFSVGLQSPPASLLPLPGTPDPVTARPPTADIVLRWLNYATAALVGGSLVFGLFVWRPVFKQEAEQVPAEADNEVTARLRRLARLGMIGLLVGTVGTVVYLSSQVSNFSPATALTATLGGRPGLLLVTRLGLLLFLFWLAGRLPPAATGKRGLWWTAVMAGLALLLTFSLQSHNAALPGRQSTIATLLDWLHLVAMSAWLGGLVVLIWLLPSARARHIPYQRLIPRFSTIALISVFVLTLTGLYSAWVHVRTMEALVSTTYGRVLLIKTICFLALIGLGAINLLVLSPRLKRDEAAAVQGLRHTVRLELALGLLVLLAAGALLAGAPAFEALQAQQRQGYREVVRQEAVRLTLRVAPLQVGENEFGVDVVDNRPGAAVSPPTVLLRLTGPERGMGTTQIETTGEPSGRFTARGSYLTVSGDWQILVILRRTGFDDVTHTFNLSVPPGLAPQHDGH